MPHRAAVLVKIPASVLDNELQPAQNPGLPGEHCYTGANGVPFGVRPLDGGAVLYTPAPYEGEADEGAYMARALLGKLLDNHKDTRGLLVFPDGSPLDARDYEGAIKDLDGLADWTPVVGPDYVPKRVANAPSHSMEGRMRDVVGAIPPQLIAQMQQAMASGDMGSLLGMQQQLEQALAAQGGLAGLQQLVGDMLSAQGMSMEDMMQSMGGGAGGLAPGGAPSEEMLREAKGELDELERTDPAKWAELDAQFGGALTRMKKESGK